MICVSTEIFIIMAYTLYMFIHHKVLSITFDHVNSIFLQQDEKRTAIKCGTFGASNLQQRYLATGDFEGKMMIWFVVLFFNLHVIVDQFAAVLNWPIIPVPV